MRGSSFYDDDFSYVCVDRSSCVSDSFWEGLSDRNSPPYSVPWECRLCPVLLRSMIDGYFVDFYRLVDVFFLLG